ncbi:hypothetical protein AVEN_274689-1 [Araneus ventricosus]|uniref:Secreted protein n=1 Tax=Araneus ventricosus TaxID=182803 RepID=A0A4Y2WA24_ARAVE|nr:hypothetical protein AVEN_274689-1 [Araneus ventricosus]
MSGSHRIPLARCCLLMTVSERLTFAISLLCPTPLDDRDKLLWIIPGRAIDGLWKGDHSRCQPDVEEWTADLCGANPQSHSDPHETL